MRIELTDEQRMLRDAVRDFAEKEVAPRAAALDRTQEFPRDIVRRAAAMNLLGVSVPPEHGGGGMDTVSYAIAIEEIARACASTAVILSVNNSLVCDPILEFGSDEQRGELLAPLASGEKLGCYALTEPDSGSDAAALRTTCRPDAGGYVLDGSKIFVTNGTDADVVLVYATLDRALGHRGVCAFLVDRGTPGMEIRPEGEKLGVRASGTAEIHFDGCRVPLSRRLGAEGQGFKIALRTLDGGRIGIAAQAVGIARAALEEATRYSMTRKAFDQPISSFQAIQFMLADMATEVDAARLLTWKAAWSKDQARIRGGDVRFTLEAATAKLFASETANRCASRALQIHGGYGYTKEYPVERHFRDARITEIYEGTSEIQRLVIAASVLDGAA